MAGLAQQADSGRPPPGPARWVLIVANLVPLIGVLFFDWDLMSILLLYWLETLIVAALAVLPGRPRSDGRRLLSRLTLALVFLVLSAGHLATLVVLARAVGLEEPTMPDLSAATQEGLFSALQTIYPGALAWISSERPAILLYGLPSLVISRFFSSSKSSGSRPTAGGSGGAAPAADPSGQALGRLIALHLALLLGGALIAWLEVDALLPVLALLILIKLLLDLRSLPAAATP